MADFIVKIEVNVEAEDKFDAVNKADDYFRSPEFSVRLAEVEELEV